MRSATATPEELAPRDPVQATGGSHCTVIPPEGERATRRTWCERVLAKHGGRRTPDALREVQTFLRRRAAGREGAGR